MTEAPYELVAGPEGVLARIRARGEAVLATPTINRGTAFTREDREALGLTGLLPSGVSTMDAQLRRVYAQYSTLNSPLRRYVFLADLRDRNAVLFYRLLSEHFEEMLPVVYTPTVGEAIEQYNRLYRRPGGVYLSIDAPEDIEVSFRNLGLGAEDVDLLIATDSEGILGIGDQGVGGIEIVIGKLSVYAAAGMHPHRMIPVVLDVGTDNLRLLNDEMYLGNRHARVRGARYDEFIDHYVATATRLFPNAMLHWEDLGTTNARRILERHAAHCCTFNDDMQGTAVVVLAAAVAAVGCAGGRMQDQRIVVHGAGTAGIGIADMLRDRMVDEGLTPQEAARHIWAIGRRGLLTDEPGGYQYDFQQPYARPTAEVAGWSGGAGAPSLAEVVARVRPTLLIGTSTQARAFNEPIVRQMAAHVERPIILPLSNPTSRSEADPSDLIRWTDGRALIATGSPFPPVEHAGVRYQIAQANNALVFPGLGIGVTVAKAGRVTTGMLAAAAAALARLADATAPGAPLLPSLADIRAVSAAVAAAVTTAAVSDEGAGAPVSEPIRLVHEAMWRPEYPGLDCKPT